MLGNNGCKLMLNCIQKPLNRGSSYWQCPLYAAFRGDPKAVVRSQCSLIAFHFGFFLSSM